MNKLLALLLVVFVTVAPAAQRPTEESFIPSYSAGNLYYLWGSRSDLEDTPSNSMQQQEVGLLAQYPFLMTDTSRLTAGIRVRWNQLDFETPLFSDLDRLDLYRLQIPVNYWHAFSDQWKLWAGVDPGVFSDLRRVSGDDFTASALVVAACEFSPAWSLSFGGYYSRDLGDDRLLPVLGFIWRPNPHWNVSATFPRFRVAYAPNETANFDLTLRPGGSGWNVRAAGQDLDLEYKSWRVSLGAERLITTRVLGRIYGFGEVGLGFRQELEIESESGADVFTSDLAETFIASAGLRLRF